MEAGKAEILGRFSSKAYLARYPDVAEANLNALLHYETLGRVENRIVAV